MTKVTKAVIAAAGFGTRFLPQTKAMPKEMLPLIDKPIIQYVVEELVEAGIKDIIIISNSNKRSIEDHFDVPNRELVENLQAGGEKKAGYLHDVEHIADLANFIYVRQKGAYGNATPVQCAAHLLGDEPFIYTFADDFFIASPGRTKQLIETYNAHGGSVLACKLATDDAEYDRYGFAGGTEVEAGVIKVDSIIEKPGKQAAPSALASVSGYLLTPDIFKYLDEAALGHGSSQGELMIQPIMQQMIEDGLPIYAREVQNGRYYDTGDRVEYLKTMFEFALARDDIGPELREYLQKILQ